MVYEQWGDQRVTCGDRVVAPAFVHGGSPRWWSVGDEVRQSGGSATRRWQRWRQFGAGRSMEARRWRRGGARVEVGKNLQWGSSGCYIKGCLAHDIRLTGSEPRLSLIHRLIRNSFGFGKDYRKGTNPGWFQFKPRLWSGYVSQTGPWFRFASVAWCGPEGGAAVGGRQPTGGGVGVTRRSDRVPGYET
jgi:hypothetical protein